LEPYACKIPEDEFGQLTHSRPIRAVFDNRECVLQAIFDAYSVEVSTNQAKDSRIADVDDADAEGHERIMEVDKFVSLMSAAGLVHGTLTKEVVESLFMKVVRHSGRHRNDPKRITCAAALAKACRSRRGTPAPVRLLSIVKAAGGDVSATLDGQCNVAFFEFLHCLLAVALYTNPNPMVAVQLRVEHFLGNIFLRGLIAHVQDMVATGPEYQVLLEALTDVEKADHIRMDRHQERRSFLQRTLAMRHGGATKEPMAEQRASSADNDKEKVVKSAHQSRQVSLRRVRSQSPFYSRVIR
jgi:hypothetical protein